MTEDYIVHATAANAMLRAFAIQSNVLAETAREKHQTSPVATAALGRFLSAGAMMGAMMKGEDDVLTLQIKSDGPIGGLTVTADSHGHVKGYAQNPFVDLPLNPYGKLDVGGAVGNGTLSVIRDLGLKEPYTGVCELISGEIGDDLAYYFNVSEQTPSAVGLGVLVGKDLKVRQAGGFIIQVMPDAPENVVSNLENRLKEVTSITALMEEGKKPEDILEVLLGDLDLTITQKTDARFHCDCSKTKMAKALIAVGAKELGAMIDDGKPVEVKCHFCNTSHEFSIAELKALQGKALSHIKIIDKPKMINMLTA